MSQDQHIPGPRPVMRRAAGIAAALGDFAPTEEQREIIEAPLEPTLVVAGAGSGKTATMADRVVFLVANGWVRPDQILGVTFTRKAAGELRERVTGKLARLVEEGLLETASLLPDQAEVGEAQDLEGLLAPAISTYHSYANSLVSEYGLHIGLEPDTELIGQAKAWQLVSELVDGYDRGRHLVEADASGSSLPSQVITLASECAEHLCTPPEVQEFIEAELARAERYRQAEQRKMTSKIQGMLDTLRLRWELAELAERYQRRKAADGFMDYGDLLRHAARIAAEVPAASEAERSRYSVVLLDEFQDTSYAQLELFASLFGKGTGHAVTAVGDPNQSIYGFRGASAGQLFSFPREFPRRDSETGVLQDAPLHQLTIAWRNGRRILDAANRTVLDFRQDADRADALPWHRHTAQQRRTLKPLITPDRAQKPDGTPVVPPEKVAEGELRYGWYRTEQQEAEAVVAQLADVVAQDRRDAEAARASGEEFSPRSCAVLSRTRGQLETIAERMRAAGMKYELVGLSGLLSTAEVAEVLAYLHVIADPKRNDALLRILAGARHRIGPKDLLRLGQRAEGRASWRTRRERRQGEGHAQTGSHAQNGYHAQNGNGAEAGDTERFGDLNQELDEMASLAEALDSLPGERHALSDEDRARLTDPAQGFSEAGALRLLRARDDLRRLRQWASVDLGTLIQRVISETGLEVEVAARPWEEQQHATRQLDALIGQAESFASTKGRTDLVSFLEWLQAAEDQERGLEQVQTEPEPGSIQLLTVHASKGLEWDVVVVAGMREGRFPSDRVTRWTGRNGQLPWPLRGDRESIPQWDVDWDAIMPSQQDGPQEDTQHKPFTAWAAACGAAGWSSYEGRSFPEDCVEFSREEERRLAYVAVTRAKSLLICTGACFYGAGQGKPVSQFLEELVEAAQESLVAGRAEPSDVVELHWEEIEQEELTLNPAKDDVLEAEWPFDPLAPLSVRRRRRQKADLEDPSSLDELVDVGPAAEDDGLAATLSSRRPALEAAAQLVRDQRAEGVSLEEASAGAAWLQEAGFVVNRARAQQKAIERPRLPTHLSASRFVAMAQNAAQVAEQTRRPVPQRPSSAARRGTIIHARVEEYFETPAGFEGIEEPLRGDAELDDTLDVDAALENLRESRWGERPVYAAEIPIETSLAGVMLRGRIDAVFGWDASGAAVDGAAHGSWEQLPRAERNAKMAQCSWELVDWKTGAVPQGEELRIKQLQLAVYRLAFSRIYEVPPEQIRAFFFYIDHGVQVEAEGLPEADAMEQVITAASAHFG